MTTPTQAADELQALRAFAQDVMEDWPEGAPDGFDLQELAVKHGLLKLADPAPTEPCRENCWCAQYFGPTEWARGVQCFRKTALLTDSESSDLARLSAANAALTEAQAELRELAKLAYRALCDAEAVINTIDGECVLESMNLEELQQQIGDCALHLFTVLGLPSSELRGGTPMREETVYEKSARWAWPDGRPDL